LGEVEEQLRRQSRGHGELLSADLAATLSAGGKRLRPLLVLLCAGANGGEEAMRAATAIELVHMATLVHDDVLDAAPLRRGQPTIAAASGRGRAVSAGDLLFSRAFSFLAEHGDSRSVALLAEASAALARGELAQRQDAFDTEISEQRYLERCHLKTAKLFECACLLGWSTTRHPRTREAGRETSGCDERGRPGAEEMAEFGSGIGLAFQLLDDVLDVSGPAERTGKARGTDLLDGTVTLPLILAAAEDPSIGSTDLRALDPAAAEALCDRIAATGALDQVRSRAFAMVAAAKDRLDAAAFDPEQRQLLGLVADGVVQRYS
jgi:geranylgeranyl pyrophosphate synthase